MFSSPFYLHLFCGHFYERIFSRKLRRLFAFEFFKLDPSNLSKSATLCLSSPPPSPPSMTDKTIKIAKATFINFYALFYL